MSTMSTTINMVTLPTEMEGRPRTGSTLSRVFKLDPDEATPARSISTQQAPALHPHLKDDPPIKFHPLCDISFLMKLGQLALACLCLGLHTQAMLLITTNNLTQTFPLIVCAAYMIITPVILLSFVLGQKMPELLIRVFNLIGGILFFITAVILIVQWATFRKGWLDPHESGSDNTTEEHLDTIIMEATERIKMLLAECLFSMIASALFLSDVILSIRRTLAFF